MKRAQGKHRLCVVRFSVPECQMDTSRSKTEPGGMLFRIKPCFSRCSDICMLFCLGTHTHASNSQCASERNWRGTLGSKSSLQLSHAARQQNRYAMAVGFHLARHGLHRIRLGTRGLSSAGQLPQRCAREFGVKHDLAREPE